MKKFISLLFTFFLAFTLACDDSDSNDSGDDVTDPVETRGSLDVILTWPSGSVTSPSVTAYLTPDEGTAESIDFTVGKNSASCTESGLDAGSYTLALELLDGTQTAWDGTRDISITGGETTEVAIALDEDDIETPQGSLSVTITWPENEVMSPSVEAELTPEGGTAETLDFILSDNSASFSGTGITAGDGDLSLKLLENGSAVWAETRSISIPADGTRELVIDLTADDLEDTSSYYFTSASGNSKWITVDYWTGTGSCETILVVDWNNAGDWASPSHAFGYRWDCSETTVAGMIDSICANGDLSISTGYGGAFVNNLYYNDADGDVHQHTEEGSWNLGSTDDVNAEWGDMSTDWTMLGEWEANQAGITDEYIADGQLEGINLIWWFDTSKPTLNLDIPYP